MYKYYSNSKVTPVDIDDTIIRWNKTYREDAPGRVKVVCPYTGLDHFFEPMHRHIDFVKQMKGRGDLVVVWSASGGPWAKAVIDAVGLADHVDLIFAKFQDYLDDKNVQDWAGHRIYLEDEEIA